MLKSGRNVRVYASAFWPIDLRIEKIKNSTE